MNDYADPLLSAKKNLKAVEDYLLHKDFVLAKEYAKAVNRDLERVIQWIDENK